MRSIMFAAVTIMLTGCPDVTGPTVPWAQASAELSVAICDRCDPGDGSCPDRAAALIPDSSPVLETVLDSCLDSIMTMPSCPGDAGFVRPTTCDFIP